MLKIVTQTLSTSTVNQHYVTYKQRNTGPLTALNYFTDQQRTKDNNERALTIIPIKNSVTNIKYLNGESVI